LFYQSVKFEMIANNENDYIGYEAGVSVCLKSFAFFSYFLIVSLDVYYTMCPDDLVLFPLIVFQWNIHNNFVNY